MEIVRYRALRQSCRITITELSRALGISTQRLSQIELAVPGHRPENPERFIAALETAAEQRVSACEKALSDCKTLRCDMFKHIEKSEV